MSENKQQKNLQVKYYPYEGGLNYFEIEHEYIMEEFCQENCPENREDITNRREEQSGLETSVDYL